MLIIGLQQHSLKTYVANPPSTGAGGGEGEAAGPAIWPAEVGTEPDGRWTMAYLYTISPLRLTVRP